MDYEDLYKRITKRYGGVSPESLERVLTPVLIPIKDINREVFKVEGQSHWRASFTLKITSENAELMQRGRTGKFVPKSFVDGGPWREICKGRIIDVDFEKGIANGEIYVGRKKSALQEAVELLHEGDFLEIDQYGASAKIVSGLAEYHLAELANESGYVVRRMPEDTARHLGAYYNYDFEFEKDGITKKIEVKSLWGTNTDYARLIHSTGPGYPTSSCKFETQDIFAVSLFLRTGNIRDFAFARSVSIKEKPYGLNYAEKYPEHVNQNPLCAIGNSSWFATIDEVWDLE